MIVKDFHESLLHITVKQTLTELRQKYWIYRGRNFVRKYEGPLYQYPPTPSLTKLRLNNTFVYFNTGIYNFGPLYVRSIFTSNTGSSTIHKVWVTLYTCASIVLSIGIVLDLLPSLDSVSFIRSFRRFISQKVISDNGKNVISDNVISDNEKNFVSVKTKRFVSSIGVN